MKNKTILARVSTEEYEAILKRYKKTDYLSLSAFFRDSLLNTEIVIDNKLSVMKEIIPYLASLNKTSSMLGGFLRSIQEDMGVYDMGKIDNLLNDIAHLKKEIMRHLK